METPTQSLHFQLYESRILYGPLCHCKLESVNTREHETVQNMNWNSAPQLPYIVFCALLSNVNLWKEAPVEKNYAILCVHAAAVSLLDFSVCDGLQRQDTVYTVKCEMKCAYCASTTKKMINHPSKCFTGLLSYNISN